MLRLLPGRLKVIRDKGSLRSVVPPQMRKVMSIATHAHGRLPDEPAAAFLSSVADGRTSRRDHAFSCPKWSRVCLQMVLKFEPFLGSAFIQTGYPSGIVLQQILFAMPAGRCREKALSLLDPVWCHRVVCVARQAHGASVAIIVA